MIYELTMAGLRMGAAAVLGTCASCAPADATDPFTVDGGPTNALDARFDGTRGNSEGSTQADASVDVGAVTDAGAVMAYDTPESGSDEFSASDDGGFFLGASRCGSTALAFCDGFEGSSIDTKIWSVSGGDASVSVDHAGRGSHSLSLVFTPGKPSPVLQMKAVPPALTQHLFGRVLVWSEESTPTYHNAGDSFDTFAHVDFFRAQSSVPTDYMGEAAGVVGSYRLTSPNDHAVSVGPFSKGQWMCWEWEFDAVNHYARGWLTTATATETFAESPRPDPNWELPMNAQTFASMRFGLLVISSPTPAMHVWVDELALDTQRIGCGR